MNLYNYKRSALILIVIWSTIFLLTTCIHKHSEDKDMVIHLPDGNRLIGTAACRNCHASIYDSFISTGHNLTSKPALQKYIKGSFEKDKNYYIYTAQDVVVMDALQDGFYQVHYKNRKLDNSYRFDMVIGSGTRGQTFLHWEGNHLFQLPVSYYTLSDTWSNSPGYPDRKSVFNRGIIGDCLGCHNSYAMVLFGDEKTGVSFDKNKIVYGVNCERCHGPGGKHVDFYTQHPDAKGSHEIYNAAQLSQRQQLDACAVCHSSGQKGVNAGLNFKTGDTITHSLSTVVDIASKLDVHGNQYGLVVATKCFRESKTITCSSCHNVHQQERGNLALFSKRCMNCHAPESDKFCKMAPSLGKAALVNNCIDCHMPVGESHTLNVKVAGVATHKPAVLRTHFITVYPDETKKFLQIMKNSSFKKEVAGN